MDLPNGGTYVPVKKKKAPRGRSAKRPAADTEGPSLSPSPGNAPSEGGAGTDAAAESFRRQESLVRDAEKLDEALRRTYDGMDELLAHDFNAQFHKSAQALNAADQNEFVNGILFKQGRLARIKNMDQGNPQSKWSTDLKALKECAIKDMKQFRAAFGNMSREAKQMWSDKLRVHKSVYEDRLRCCKGETVVFDCSSYSQAWDHLVGGQPKRRKTDTASTGASTSHPTPEDDHLRGESDVSMDDGDGVDDDKLKRPRSVARTLGNRRFTKAPGPLSFDESQQLAQGVAADALDNVLELLQRKTREAFVVPWYKRVKRGWTYLHDGELCELHAVEYAKDKEPRLMVRLLERNTVAPKIIELREGDVSKLTVFKRPKPTETHTTPTWAQYVEATKASDGPGSHCSSCFKPLGREEPCSKYGNVMPVLHLCDECVRREQPWSSTMNTLLGSLGPAIRFDLRADAMADLASVCSESIRSKLDVVVAAPCPRCNHLFWESVGEEKLYKTTPFTFVNISTAGLTMSEQPLVTWRCDCNPDKLVEPRLEDAAMAGLSAVRAFVRPEEDGRSVINTSARGQVFANAAGMDGLAALRFGAHVSFKHCIECMQETSRSHGMLVTPMSSRLRGELLRAVTLRQRVLHVLRRQLTAHLGLAECLVCSTATDSILVDFTHANSQRERKARKPLAEDAEEAPMDDAATTVDAATSSTVDGAPSASATAPTAAPESTQGVASASSAAPSASSDGAAPMAPSGATPSSPTSDATTLVVGCEHACECHGIDTSGCSQFGIFGGRPRRRHRRSFASRLFVVAAHRGHGGVVEVIEGSDCRGRHSRCRRRRRRQCEGLARL